MFYLFWKIFLCILVAGAIGAVIGWLLRGSGSEEEVADYAARTQRSEDKLAQVLVERDRLKEALSTAEDGRGHDSDEVDGLKERIAELARENESLSATNAASAAAAAGLAQVTSERDSSQLAAQQAEVELAELRKQLADTRAGSADSESLKGELVEAKAALATAQGDTEAYLRRIGEMEGELASLRGQLEGAEEGDGDALQAAQARVSTLEAELRACKSARSALEARPGPGASAQGTTSGSSTVLSAMSTAPQTDPELEEATLEEDVPEPKAAEPKAAEPEADAPPSWLLTAPDGAADDLKRIKGIGPVLEKKLNGLGIFHFRQLADLDDASVKWVSTSIKTFPDRIHRDKWVEQAKRFASE